MTNVRRLTATEENNVKMSQHFQELESVWECVSDKQIEGFLLRGQAGA